MKLLLEVPRDRIAVFEAGIAEKYGLEDSAAMKISQGNSRDVNIKDKLSLKAYRYARPSAWKTRLDLD